MMSQVQFPLQQREENSYIKGKRKMGGHSKQSPVGELRIQSVVAFHWLSYECLRG